MYRIVAGIDDSDDRARRLADAIGDLPGRSEELAVTLLHDFVDNPEGASVTQVGAVGTAEDRLGEHGVDVSLREASGDPAEAILRAAREEAADLIAVAPREHTPAGKAIFGSVSQDVILGSERPVLVVGGPDA